MNAQAAAASVGRTDNEVSHTFLSCLSHAQRKTKPFDHWFLTKALRETDIDGLLALPIAPPADVVFNGRRETNNSSRIFFSKESQEKFPVCKRLADGFNAPHVRAAIEKETGTKLAGTYLRIEYCQDGPGFWLEPHTDIMVKKFTMLVYLLDDPELKLAGTDIHGGPPDFPYVGTAPYGRNLGVIFIPGKNSWHGVGHHPLKKLRKSIIINFVDPSWRDKWELA